MPMQSKAQNAAMHAAAAGNSTLGIPKSVGQDFVNASHGENVKALPQKASGPSSALEAMTGLPSGKKKTRRGGGRHKGASAKPKMSAQDHHNALNAAMAKGDSAGAKISALHLAKALHKATAKPTVNATAAKPGAPSPQQQPGTPDDEGLVGDLNRMGV